MLSQDRTGALGTKLNLTIAPCPTEDGAESPTAFVATTYTRTFAPVTKLYGEAYKV